MWISITIVVISTALLMLQFFKQSKLSWKIALIMCSVLLVLSILNIKNQDDIQKFTIHSLEKIAGRILWEDSSLILSFQNKFDEVDPRTLGAQVKLLSLNSTLLPKGQKPLQYFFEKCKKDSVFEYSYLPPEYAKNLFNAFAEENGDIYDKKEDIAGVERFWFSGVDSESTYTDFVLVSTKLEFGADVNSNFTSLSDLNGSIILAYINTGIQSQSVWPTSINWKLKTSAGQILMFMPLRINLQDNNKGIFIHKYVGICIPHDFFDSAKQT